MRLSALIITLVLAATICSGCRTTMAGQCPEAMGLRCLTRKVCSFDTHRGCNVCACAPPDSPHQQNQPHYIPSPEKP